jgi:hypothetical protein
MWTICGECVVLVWIFAGGKIGADKDGVNVRSGAVWFSEEVSNKQAGEAAMGISPFRWRDCFAGRMESFLAWLDENIASAPNPR